MSQERYDEVRKRAVANWKLFTSRATQDMDYRDDLSYWIFVEAFSEGQKYQAGLIK